MVKIFCFVTVLLFSTNLAAESDQKKSSEHNQEQSAAMTKPTDTNEKKVKQPDNKKPNMAEYCRKYTC